MKGRNIFFIHGCPVIVDLGIVDEYRFWDIIEESSFKPGEIVQQQQTT